MILWAECLGCSQLGGPPTSAGLCSVSLASRLVGRERTGLADPGWLISTPSSLSSPGRVAGLAYMTSTIRTRHTASALQLLTHSGGEGGSHKGSKIQGTGKETVPLVRGMARSLPEGPHKGRGGGSRPFL